MYKTNGTILDVPGIKVGHAEDELKQTGCSVIIFDDGAVCGVDVRGSAPGTRETELLDPINTVQKTNALVLSGGSAFGLDSASGVMRYLEERKKGFDVGVAVVPIVPAAIIFDLNFGDPAVRPDANMGYIASKNASTNSFPSGNIGAGAGATIGKMAGFDKAMKGGLGTASVKLAGGLTVGAMVVVNAVGEIRDPKNGKTIAGACDENGHLIDLISYVLENYKDHHFTQGKNTTIGIICCNANMNKSQMKKVAQMAHDGLARTIYPVHTMSDGDTIFAATTGGVDSSVNIVGMLAAEVMAVAVLDAVKSAKSKFGVRGYADLANTSISSDVPSVTGANKEVR
ncbi:P1 family peptidase [Photorhabdus heterorhabditis]|uniref:P1 family peptidase n=1 Tax=Photorhabdus heterorhabditis TaxID=880156 RepID=A0A5B0WT16_9GAMM|nr:P1 family peptidase [Photorhabdus heterorhabditis]KAA1190164.1 P1 family peptidase [Photorhabdus heterorhabditis]KOY63802.1 peptidase S58 [Photorhabdus heterorhabditis]MBS9440682.1 peptidase S58 family protein [Photorhabdus heterorhabditis]